MAKPPETGRGAGRKGLTQQIKKKTPPRRDCAVGAAA